MTVALDKKRFGPWALDDHCGCERATASSTEITALSPQRLNVTIPKSRFELFASAFRWTLKPARNFQSENSGKRVCVLPGPTHHGLGMHAAENIGCCSAIDETLNGDVCFHRSIHNVQLMDGVTQWFGSGEPEIFLSGLTFKVASRFKLVFARAASAFVTVRRA